MPPESWSTLLLALSSSAAKASSSSAFSWQTLAGQAEVPAVDVEVLARVELAVEVVLLRDDAQARADLGAVLVGVEAQDREVALRARRDGADHLHRGRLARAVRAEQAEGLAGRDLEREPVDGQEVGLALDLVGLHEVLRVDHGGRHWTTLAPGCGQRHGGRDRSATVNLS